MRIDLYVDVVGGLLVSNPYGPAPFTMPILKQNDTVPFRVYLLQRTTNYPYSVQSSPAFELINNASLSLKMAIGVKSGTGDGDLVASQFNWAKDPLNQYFYADLALNTQELADAMGDSASITRVLELEVTRNGLPNTVYQGPVQIDADVIKNTTITPQPGLTPLSAEEAAQTYVRQFGLPGQTITLVSPNGQWARIIGIGDDGTRIDQVEQL